MAKAFKVTANPEPSRPVRSPKSGGKVLRPQTKDGNVYYVTLDGEVVKTPDLGVPATVVRGATLFPVPSSKPQE